MQGYRILTAMLLILLILTIPGGVLAFEIERPNPDQNDNPSIGVVYDNATTNGMATVGLNAQIAEYHQSGYGTNNNSPAAILYLLTSANTRVGIYYNNTADGYHWHSASEMSGIISGVDNTVVGPIYWHGILHDDGIYRDTPVRYYGGPGTDYMLGGGGSGDGEYTAMYICTNGWISFADPNSTAPPPVQAPPIPYRYGQVKTLVLPYCGILKPSQGGAVRYGFVEHQVDDWGGRKVHCLCISWDNIPDEHGKPQSFQILIDQEPVDANSPRQTYIWFQYKQVNINSYYNVGLEDQTGCRAFTISCNPDPHNCPIQNSSSIMWMQGLQQVAAYIGSITMTMLRDDNTTASTVIETTTNRAPRGYNLNMETTLPNDGLFDTVVTALDDTSTCVGAYVFAAGVTLGTLAAGAGVMFGVGLMLVDTWNRMTRYLASLQLYKSNNLDYGIAQAKGTQVDARLGMIVDWAFLEQSPWTNHTITITATLSYYTVDFAGTQLHSFTVPVSVQIKMFYPYNSDSFSNVWQLSPGLTYDWLYISSAVPSAFYKIYVPKGNQLSVWVQAHTTTKPIGLKLYNQMNGPPISDDNRRYYYAAGSYIATSSTWIWMQVYYQTGGDTYYSISPNITPVGGGGCPFVCPWNGTTYVVDNNLLGASEKTNGADVQDYYKLEQTLAPTYQGKYFSTYSLQISEFEHEHSYIDQAQLFSIDTGSNTMVAVTPTGEIMTYEHPHPPMFAVDQNSRDWGQALSVIGDGSYYKSAVGDYLTLYFGSVNGQNAKLVLREDMTKDSIHVSLLTMNGSWLEISDIPGRVSWATDILDLSPYLGMTAKPLTIRLSFTAVHKLDFVGLDTSPPANVKISQGLLTSAQHSVYGNVWSQLFLDDGNYVQLTPGQQITLKFLLPTANVNLNRTFILSVDGHYFTTQ